MKSNNSLGKPYYLEVRVPSIGTLIDCGPLSNLCDSFEVNYSPVIETSKKRIIDKCISLWGNTTEVKFVSPKRFKFLKSIKSDSNNVLILR